MNNTIVQFQLQLLNRTIRISGFDLYLIWYLFVVKFSFELRLEKKREKEEQRGEKTREENKGRKKEERIAKN